MDILSGEVTVKNDLFPFWKGVVTLSELYCLLSGTYSKMKDYSFRL